MDKILSEVRQRLRESSNEKDRESGLRFFREEIHLYGMKSAIVGQISKEYLKEINRYDKAHIFALCEDLWQSGMMEESFIACDWSYSVRKEYLPDDFNVFERWVKNYVSNWASCDTLCNHTVGTFIDMYPVFLEELKKWTSSPNRWVKRASAVSLVLPARQGRYLDDIFGIADRMLTDGDDMVQKGYGWMLKEASKAHLEEVYDYVLKHRADMPRTALRYAIEKMPPELRKEAMKRI
jgi:3-methyladenine DNA glycosylase AlkD